MNRKGQVDWATVAFLAAFATVLLSLIVSLTISSQQARDHEYRMEQLKHNIAATLPQEAGK